MTEIADIYEIKKTKARKRHECIACRNPIPIGDEYHTHSSLFDGRWTKEKICDPCEAKRCKINEGLHFDDMLWPYDMYDNVEIKRQAKENDYVETY